MILELKNLHFNYANEKILNDVSFSMQKGEFLGIMGPNGGGKSTLLKCILNLLKPSFGQVKMHTNKFSYVPQFAEINKAFATTVLDVVLSGELNSRSLFFANKASKQKALEKLKLVKMQDFAALNVHNLSGGQAQRVLIARALMSDCELLLLDEPTASIDIKGQIEIFELLSELKSQLSLLCVCHDLALLSAFADRILHVNKSAHFHNFCEHEKAARLAMLAKDSAQICEIEMLNVHCQKEH